MHLSRSSSPHFLMDTGNPTLNGVLKISWVGAAHAASQEAYSLISNGTEASRSMSQMHATPFASMPSPGDDVQKLVMKAAKECLQ